MMLHLSMSLQRRFCDSYAAAFSPFHVFADHTVKLLCPYYGGNEQLTGGVGLQCCPVMVARCMRRKLIFETTEESRPSSVGADMGSEEGSILASREESLQKQRD
jgi:hypothetical protein